ncbi:polysaccharide deacetylase [Candidatus Methanoplasma termitum]|uniref:Polysaccharide deacetylase n=1 Tax=Candidatus Methanoplasma termitum TaxID=1577791 RepID=A0A0A7LDB8_9ARCH|nr:polysaccharide deacetylase family protein [Candidatus Methanoplasma termitum]AIZ57135.1 polysaccharide deacetylase [Candidatus Methanoplasma termitum]
MRALCFTVDLDRDVNIQIEGGRAAGSIDRGSGTGPRFSSSLRGLSILVDLLDEIGMKATFFAEASTLRNVDAETLSGHEVGIHGMDHEDLTLIKGMDSKRRIIEDASAVIKDTVGTKPESFRAPYMRIDEETVGLLPEVGIKTDSSRYAAVSGSMMPKRIGSGLWEVPVPEGKDEHGKKITAYLWPMHESKREPEDYLRLASVMDEGAFVLSTHTWHMVESRERGMMSADEIGKNTDNLRKVLEETIDMGMRPLTMADVRKRMEANPR